MINKSKALFGILILVAGFAWFVINQQQTGEQPPMSALMPAWQNNPELINEVTRVELRQHGEQLTIDKHQQHWVLNDGFFVNMESLSSLFQSLQVAITVEAKTANPDNHERLDLGDDDLTVSLYQGDQLVKAIHLGKTSTAGHRFVRFAGEAQTYLVQGLQPVTFNEDSWTLKTVLDIPASDIQSIRIQPQDGEAFTVSKTPEGGQWMLNEIPDGQQLKDSANLDVLSQGLTRLMIDSAEPSDADDLTPVVTLTYQLVNGSDVQLGVYQQDEAHYVRISGDTWAHYNPWLMRIAAYKFDALNQSLDQFIEPVAAEESTGETE